MKDNCLLVLMTIFGVGMFVSGFFFAGVSSTQVVYEDSKRQHEAENTEVKRRLALYEIATNGAADGTLL